MAKVKSNKLITNFPVPLSEEENQNLNLTLSGVLTGKGIWRPAVNASGEISWTYDEENSRDVPTPMNIRGPEGKAPFLRVNSANSHLEWSRDRIYWEDTKQTTSGAVGPAGKDGADGTNGTNGTDGVTPVVSVEAFSHMPTDPENTNGGTRISFNYGEGDPKNISYSAFNGAYCSGGGGGSYRAGQGIRFTENDTTINAKLNGPDIGFDTAGNICFNTDGVDGGGFWNMVEGHETWASGAANHVEGMWTWAKGQGNHAQNVGCSAVGYGVNAQGLWTCFVSDSGNGGDKWWNHGAGASVEGICNKTRQVTYSGENETRGPVHEGILKVIGNGHRLHPDVREDASYVLSDAFIFYRDGTLWTAGDIEVEGKIRGSIERSESARYAEQYMDDDGSYRSFSAVFDQLEKGKLDQTVWDNVSADFLQTVNAAGSLSGNGTDESPIGINESNMASNNLYGWDYTTHNWSAIPQSVAQVEHDSTLSGDGTADSKLGIDGAMVARWNATSALSAAKLDKTVWDETSGSFLQEVETNNSVSGDGSVERPIGLEGSVLTQLSKIEYKSSVTSGAGNVFTVNDGTSSNPEKNFTFSAVNYKSGQTANYLAQQLFVVASDNEIISLVNGGAADGKGCLFFRVE